jgi:hypothetical protein
VYDEARQRLLLFGGDTEADGALGDTWEREAATWLTIMGILSAFCMGAAALVAREVLTVSGHGQLFAGRQGDFYYIVTGSGLMVVAAAAFYWQRAQLAWHYGQVSLWATDATVSGRELPDILRESDTWAVWIPYQSGLWLTAAGLLAYFGALSPIPEEYEVAYVLALTMMALLAVGVIVLHAASGKEEGKRPPDTRTARWDRCQGAGFTVSAVKSGGRLTGLLTASDHRRVRNSLPAFADHAFM